jgi:opacity protein-like surface antigen
MQFRQTVRSTTTRSTTTRLAAAAGAAALAVVGTTLPAAAVVEEPIEINGRYGSGYFFSQDEVIRATDTVPDGYGVRVYLHWGSTQSASAHANKGAFTKDETDLDIREGTRVDLTRCYTNNGVDVKCGTSVEGEA